MSESKFKTLRHVETVRIDLNFVISELLHRQARHDQSKLRSPEVEVFDEYTPKLRGCTYGSEEYRKYMEEMSVALEHHYSQNRHHPEHFPDGINEMNLVDLVEMLCDWKAASLRHDDGDIMESIRINQDKFGYSDELKRLLCNTARLLDDSGTYHHAEES